MTIYVSGAPGNVGTELVRLLSSRGERVRALVHKPESAASLQLPGVETVQGDLEATDSLDQTVAGADRVFVNSSTVPAAILAQKNLIDAAKRAGVRHIVKLSWIGASPDSPASFGRAQAEAQRHLEQSGVPYTTLRPSGFMQNFLGQAGTIASQSAFYGATGEGKAGYVDARDIAAVAAVTLTEPGHEGQVYEITGPEALSYGDIARIISKVVGRPVNYVNLDGPQLLGGLKSNGFPDWLAEDFVKLEAYISEGKMSRVTDVVARLAKKQPTSFEAFAREFAGMFAKA